MSQVSSPGSEGRSNWLKWCAAGFLALVVAALMLGLMARAFVHAPSIGCLSNLKMIHLAARVWADEHRTKRLPTDFILFTNQMGLPKVLKCQADYQHSGISAWSDLATSNISYVILTNGASGDSTNEYVVCTHHRYSVMGNGGVSHVYRANGRVVSTKP